jgi:exodeoxyribonuclease V alpha subunit
MSSVEIRRATVKTVTFHNPDNGWSVVKLLRPGEDKPFTAVGTLPRVTPGETLELTGAWIQHETFGVQFSVNSCKPVAPEGREAVERYLGGGAIKGIGPVLARKLVDAFGEDTFAVLDDDPGRLDSIPSLRGRRKRAILEAWEASKAGREVMFFLQAHQLSLGLSHRLIRHYGAGAAELLKANPYRLADDLWGIGFLKADDVARKLGFPDDGYERIRAGLAYALARAAESGHVFLPAGTLVEKAAELLHLELDAIVYTLDNMAAIDSIKRDEHGNCYLPWLYHAETGLAKRAGLLRLGLKPLSAAAVESAVAAAEQHIAKNAGAGFRFSDDQRHGIAQAVNEGLFLLTGGPGTGKTTTVSAVLQVFARAGLDVKLAAPTGRAARRLSDVTGRRASTLHRLLQYDPSTRGFLHDEQTPLPCGALIVDEVSMIDTALMYSLLRAVKPGTRLVLVGDPDQLPSIGAGKVLGEFIRSQTVPHLHLAAIFRQAEASRIVTNAHRVNRGLAPDLGEGARSEEDTGNFHFVERGETGGLLDAVVEMACDRLPRRFGFDPVRDVQVLTPMNQGPLGTQVLNEALQARLNPKGPALTHRGRLFRSGDKIMQLKNNYEKNVFNGDFGRVLSVDTEEGGLTADFDGERVTYAEEELDQINLAYAATIHKSQGSEFKAVVLALSKSHFVMLQRNLFYTAITRAREQLVIVGHRAAVHRCVDNNPAVQRYTLLAERLKEHAR